MKSSKKAFAFSLFALFLSLILFSFSVFIYEDEQYTKEDTFKEARLSSLSNELNYFREVYLEEAFSFALYRANDALLNWTFENPQLLSQNPDLFQELLFEAVVNGSINGSSQASLEGYSLSDFIVLYKTSFEEEHRGEINVSMYSMRFYEEHPYSMSADALFGIQVGMDDSLASWDFNDTLSVETLLYGLDDPEFLLYTNQNKTLQPIEFFSNQANWTKEAFNASLNESYSTVYIEPTYNVTIGLSYLRRLLNFSEGSIENVLASWNFDSELDQGVLDLVSLQREKTFFGNSLALYSFDTDTQDVLDLHDLSHYEHDAVLGGGVDCTSSGISGESCSFDGVDDFVSFDSFPDDFFDSDFSISFWFGSSSTPLDDAWILSKGGLSTPHLIFFLDTTGHLRVSLEDDSELFTLSSLSTLDNGVFHHIVLSVKRNSELALYVDGRLEDLEEGDFSTLSLDTPETMTLGLGSPDANNPFEGFVDELLFYKAPLERSEVSLLFDKRSVYFLDQKDSPFEKDLFFDGIDDYFNTTKDIASSSPFSLEFWFKAEDLGNGSTQSLVSKIDDSNFEWTVELDSEGFLVFEGYDILDGSSLSFQSQSSEILDNSTWYHVVVIYDGIRSFMYLDGTLETSDLLIGGALVNGNSEILIGAQTPSNLQHYFKGELDELRIYNTSLSPAQIKHHYYNFDSAVKSCCNYMTLVEPNSLGYTTPTFDELNVSYVSSSFFDVLERGEDAPDILLFELVGLSSDVPSEEHFNFVLDMCAMQAFSIFDYYNTSPRPGLLESDECSDLIAQGFR